MRKNENTNAPGKGSSTKVEPIKSERDIRNLKRLLRDKPRDLAIFVVGINVNLRASDLVRLKVGTFRNKQIGDVIQVREAKTRKDRQITINKSVYDVVQPLLDGQSDDAALFRSAKTGSHLHPVTINALVKSWCKEAGIRGKLGAHSLRKTFGFIHRTVYNTDIPTLMQMYNHSSQKQTLTYLGIQAEDLQAAYLREI